MKRFIKPLLKSLLLYVAALFCLCGCNKQDDWLNVKNNKSDVTPQTLQDFQAVLNNASVFNSYGAVMGMIGTDNLYATDNSLDAETQLDRNTYLWAKDLYQGAIDYDWYYTYQEVEYANIVLDGLNKLPVSQSNSPAGNAIKGAALFYRSFAFYQLSQLYCKPYIQSTANVDPGIPIRTTSDVNVKVNRGNVQQCYDQMTGDLKSAVSLLPSAVPYTTSPNIGVANALLAKIYLSMGDYNNAYQFADAALKINNKLLDFNTLSQTSTAPFPSFSQGNPEIIFYEYCYGTSMTVYAGYTTGRVSPDLYNAYAAGDLRKNLFYTSDGAGFYRPKAGYAAKANNFCGIANNELYLIRAESAARAGKLSAALDDLNALLQKRFIAAVFTPYISTNPDSVLAKILLERRKELPFTGNLRWEDLRRLNQDSRFAITLQHSYDGTNYTLAPGDGRYVFPIPADEINLEGLLQNPR
jgi:starch-binding outer membrane protein, SusD/RagB family